MLLFERKSSAWLALSLFLLLAIAPQYFAIAAPPAIMWFFYHELRLMSGLAAIAIAAVATNKLEPAYQNGFTLMKIGFTLDSLLGPILAPLW